MTVPEVHGVPERLVEFVGALRERGIPAVVLMAGGYGHVVDTTVDVHLQTLRIAERAQAQRMRAGVG